MLAIECRNLSKRFGVFDALKGIDLSVEQGQLYGLLGPNGAGKTTAINIFSTVLSPSSGSVKILGHDVVKEAGKIREEIGLCSGAGSFFFELTCRETLNYYAMLNGLGNADRKKRVDELIELFAIKEFENDLFRELSTGMKQKVALAKSLLNKPKVLFLDEPTIGLDVEVAREVRAIIRRLVDEQGLTVLLTSHYLFEVEELCSEVAVINQGTLVTSGRPSEIKKRMGLSEVISFAVSQMDSKRLSFLGGLRGVSSVKYEHGRMFLSSSPASSVVGRVVEEMEKRKIKVRDLEVRKPSLEEAFLRLVE